MFKTNASQIITGICSCSQDQDTAGTVGTLPAGLLRLPRRCEGAIKVGGCERGTDGTEGTTAAAEGKDEEETRGESSGTARPFTCRPSAVRSSDPSSLWGTCTSPCGYTELKTQIPLYE